MLDLVLRGGTIVDGSGLPRYLADVGIQAGKIVADGRRLADGARVPDATRKVVTPGFVGAVTWTAAEGYDPAARAGTIAT